MSDGVFVLPCRLLLPLEQRDRLERYCRRRDQELSDVVSEIVLAYLDELPDHELAAPLPPAPGPSLAEQLRQYERDLRRLRMRRQQLGSAAPPWMDGYIADVEQEIVHLRARRAAEEGAA
ncbi:MAG TPA: hypothetical protein VGE07_16270 [Herpetosiphonaceae bacterium]